MTEVLSDFYSMQRERHIWNRHKMEREKGCGGLKQMLWRQIEFESLLWHNSDLEQFT